ncbi:MAG: CBS domain-containing protein [Anaerolineae bacterium]
MLVGERMSRHPITIQEDEGVEDALKLMREQKVRRLPVLDKKGKLVGIVSEKDLLYASPSPATTLSIYELHYLLSKLQVHEVMTREVITVTEFTPIEEAARILVDHKIGGLPVMRGETLVGIITETDLFKIFLELLGAREKGVRLTVLIPEHKGMLAAMTQAIAKAGGNIIALGTFLGDDPTNRLIACKVAGVSKDTLLRALKPIALEILDVRET